MSSETTTPAFLVPESVIDDLQKASDAYRSKAVGEDDDEINWMYQGILALLENKKPSPAPSVEDGTRLESPTAEFDPFYLTDKVVDSLERDDLSSTRFNELARYVRWLEQEARRAARPSSTSPAAPDQGELEDLGTIKYVRRLYDGKGHDNRQEMQSRAMTFVGALLRQLDRAQPVAPVPPLEEQPPQTLEHQRRNWEAVPDDYNFTREESILIRLPKGDLNDVILTEDVREFNLGFVAGALHAGCKAYRPTPEESQQSASPACGIRESVLDAIVKDAKADRWVSPCTAIQLVSEIRRLAAVVTQEEQAP